MKEKGSISRKQFLKSGATVLFGTMLGRLSGQPYAEAAEPDHTSSAAADTGWEQLPLDILSGYSLVTDERAPLFGGTVENSEGFLSQYIHVFPGLEILLAGEENGWIGYNKAMQPVALLQSSADLDASKKRIAVTVPTGVAYLRGSGSAKVGQPRAWVRSFALYALNCGLGVPDLSSYTEITDLSLNQCAREAEGSRFDENSRVCPSIGDVFFSPIGTEIILSFRNANIVPQIYTGENYTAVKRQDIFTRHFGFGYSWYHCRTTDICNSLGAGYEAFRGFAGALDLQALRAAEPHLYIRFPNTVTNTLSAARVRTAGVKRNDQRLFTVVHITDTHGDADSTHAAFEYADRIGAGFAALTGDYTPYGPYHGFDILHSIINHAKTPTVYTIGNHDVLGLSDQGVDEACYAPIRAVLQASEDHSYYYRDFPYEGEIVRAISLCPFSAAAASHVNGYYSEAQLSWLCEVLAAAPANAHILILRHFSHHMPVLADDTGGMFYDYADSSVDTENLWLNMGADPVTEIVDAYTQKRSFFAQYTARLQTGTETVTVRCDFSKRPDSEFVAYLTGHVHSDAIGYARGAETKQAVLCSLCSTGVKGTAEYHSYSSIHTHRDYGTDSQIALNVFSFDFERKQIYVSRVGNGSFKDREKTIMQLSYR